MKTMDLNSWLKEYREICRELKIMPKDDYAARDLAAQIIGDREQPLDRLESLIKGKDTVVFGAGPSLEKSVKDFDKGRKTLIAADGATSCLLENGIYPNIIVTDLDGDIKDLLIADRLGAIMVVHAHGDNIEKIKKLLKKFKKVVVTTQVEPLQNVHNFLGFTDGDRAVSLAKHLGARSIQLMGFDFGDTVGRYSKPENPRNHPADEMKKKKLLIARRLVEKLKK
jgi:uncharacterized Rossmann fold enzyme